jgi:methylisocitrate lyase
MILSFRGCTMSQTSLTAGARLREAVEAERPLQVVGTINAYAARLAERTGFRAIYLSGAGVANASYGLPDLGITSCNDVCEDVRRISAATELPLLVDADTGWGGAFNIARTTTQLIRAGAAGMHLEDQVSAKRCGHRPGKALVSASEMVDRIKSAVDARTDANFVVMARTDAHAVEGQPAALERASLYVRAGADMIFAEALKSLEEFRQFAAGVGVPVLANITEFGSTPLFSAAELGAAGVRIVLYPLSAFRAAARAQVAVYGAIRAQGTQKSVLELMQTRAELYEVLGYYQYEAKLDELFGKEKS